MQIIVYNMPCNYMILESAFKPFHYLDHLALSL